MIRWIIYKDCGPTANPSRPWQLWIANGILRSKVAERSTQAYCVKAMDRIIEAL